MDTGMKIRAVDNVDDRLTKGKVYEVLEIWGGHHPSVIDDTGREAGWMTDRFEVVRELPSRVRLGIER